MQALCHPVASVKQLSDTVEHYILFSYVNERNKRELITPLVAMA